MPGTTLRRVGQILYKPKELIYSLALLGFGRGNFQPVIIIGPVQRHFEPFKVYGVECQSAFSNCGERPTMIIELQWRSNKIFLAMLHQNNFDRMLPSHSFKRISLAKAFVKSPKGIRPKTQGLRATLGLRTKNACKLQPGLWLNPTHFSPTFTIPFLIK